MVTDKKTALVTGATGKIGRAVCLELADAGYDIAVHYHRSKDTAAELVERIRAIGKEARAFDADLDKIENCEKIVKRVSAEMEPITTLIHCASEYTAMPLDEVDQDKWKDQISINLTAPFFLSRAVGMKMVQAGHEGCIVHFSDISANRPYVDYIPYCMCKAAIDSMVKGLAVKLAPKVRVNAIAPYLVRKKEDIRPQDRGHIERIPIKRHTEPVEIAGLVRLVCANDCTITGQVITIDGGRELVW